MVAGKNGATVSDEIEFEYQTAKWGKPARLQLAEIARDADTATIEATLLRCERRALPGREEHSVRFSVAGCGCLIDNQGTSTGSRVVQLYNGRARISMRRNGGASTAGVTSEGHCAGVCDDPGVKAVVEELVQSSSNTVRASCCGSGFFVW